MNKIFEYVTNQSSIFNQQPEDIVILGLRIDKLRNLEAYFRYKTGQQVTSMFESLEQYLKLLLGLSLKVCKNIIPEQEELLNLYYNLSEKERNNLVELLSVRIFFEYDHDDRFVRLFKELKADSSIVLTNKLEVFIRYLLQENKILENHIVRTHLENELKILRNNKKIHFQFNTGCMKISTIHSFKGWEAKNIFVIIEEKFSDSGFLNTFNELIYTALTRAKLNVFFINTGNSQFSELNSLLTNKEK